MSARRFSYVLSLAMLLPSLSLAQQDRTGIPSGEIRIKVSYQDGRAPDYGVRVELLSGSGIYVSEATTDDSGNAVFRQVSDGTYRARLTGSQILDLTSQDFTVDHGRSIMEMITVRPRAAEDSGGAPGPPVSLVDLNAPDNAKKEFSHGVEALEKKDWPAARKYFEKATELYPQYASAYNNLGVVLMNLGERSAGQTAFERAVSLDEHLANAHLNLGRLALADRKYAEAEAEMEKAVAIEPLNAEALLLLSHVKLLLGKYDECIANARRVPSGPQERYALAHLVAARAFEAKHVPVEAIAEYKLFLKESPHSPSAPSASAALKALQSQVH